VGKTEVCTPLVPSVAVPSVFPTGISTLLSPIVVPSGISTLLPPSGSVAPTGISTTADMDGDGYYPPIDLDDNDPDVNVLNPPSVSPTGISTTASPLSSVAPTGVSTTVSPLSSVAPTGVSTLADMDGDGYYPPTDIDDNDSDINVGLSSDVKPTGISTLRSPGNYTTSSSGDITKILIDSNTGYFIQNGALYVSGDHRFDRLSSTTDLYSTRKLVPGFSSDVLDIDTSGNAFNLGILKTNGDLHYQQLHTRIVGGVGAVYEEYGRVFSGVSKFAIGDDYIMMLMSDGSLQAVGKNNQGQFGNGETDTLGSDFPVTIPGYGDRQEPVEIMPSGSDVVDVFAFDMTTFILKSDGTLHSTGYKSTLGDGQSTVSRNTFVQIADGVSDMGGSGYYAGLLKTDGSVYTWGSDVDGKLGNDAVLGTGQNNQDAPFKIMDAGEVQQIAVGNSRMFALKTDGSVWGWGRVGVGAFTGSYGTPFEVFPSSLGITKIWSHGYTNSSGTYLFGSNGYGELSLGDSEPFGTTNTMVNGVSTTTSAVINTPTLLQESAITINTVPSGITAQQEVATLGGSSLVSAEAKSTLVLNTGTKELIAGGEVENLVTYRPRQVFATGVTYFAHSSGNVIYQKDDGKFYGRNIYNSRYGVSGIGGGENELDFHDIVEIVPAPKSTVAIRSDNSLWVVGYNDRNQLGIDPIPSNVELAYGTPGFGGYRFNDSTQGVTNPSYPNNWDVPNWTKVLDGVSKIVKHDHKVTLVTKTDGSLWRAGLRSQGATGTTSAFEQILPANSNFLYATSYRLYNPYYSGMPETENYTGGHTLLNDSNEVYDLAGDSVLTKLFDNVLDITVVAQISSATNVNQHSYYIDTDGYLNQIESPTSSTKVTSLGGGFVQVSSEWQHAVAVKSDGCVYTEGVGMAYTEGALFDATTQTYANPSEFKVWEEKYCP
jgi:alpha-tubulin suppressor-like RCC1 family protein